MLYAQPLSAKMWVGVGVGVMNRDASSIKKLLRLQHNSMTRDALLGLFACINSVSEHPDSRHFTQGVPGRLCDLQ